LASTSNAFILHSLFIQRRFCVKNGSTSRINMPQRKINAFH